MKFRRPWIKIALLLSMVAAVAFLVPVTLSYVFDRTDSVVNTFVPPDGLQDQTAVGIDVIKTVINSGKDEIGPGGFKFILENTLTGEQVTVESDFQGNASFSIPFTGADAGKSFFYSIYEVNDQRENVKYSELVYQVQIDVAMVDDKPVAKVFLDGKETNKCVVKFENLHGTVEPPSTGDEGHVAMYAVLLAVSFAALMTVLKKRKAE